MNLNSYISGFVDGEGCFCVSFNLKKRLNMGIEVRPSFSISQNKKNLKLLQIIQKNFKCGSIRFSKFDRNYKYEVRNLKNLNSIIIPHFKKYSLIGIKKDDFSKFYQICMMMKSNLHKNQDGLIKIIDLAYNMNFGKRKYSKEQLLKQIAR